MTVHLEIKGKVQGVFFRAIAGKIAEENNLTGWIRNKVGGNVEAMVNGQKENVELFINWCKEGPKNAVVCEVAITSLEETAFEGFIIKR